ncbi:PDZ domain-containing protein [Reichenbachiella sp.]|uniref:PDZ domain-containing protein n=1 Tax=Reichenbachiella sp. TaxID=2184521 RepID=UPI003BAF5655
MEEIFYPIAGVLFINTIYLSCKFFASLWLGIHENQIFLGYGEHEAIKFRVKNLTIYLGLFIPLPWVAKFYSYENGAKKRIRYEWEYEAPWFKRLFVTFSGTIGILVVSMVIFTVLAYHEIDHFIAKDEINKYGIYPSPLARSFGFEKGDKILSLNEETEFRYEELLAPKVLFENPSYLLLRDQDSVNIQVNLDFSENEGAEFRLYPNAPIELKYILPNAPAGQAGLQVGDRITHIAGNEVSCLEEIKEVLGNYREEKVKFNFDRNGGIDSLIVEVSSEGTVGFVPKSLIEYQQSRKGMAAALKEGTAKPFSLIFLNIKGLSRLFGAEELESKKVNGPIRLSNLYSNSTSGFFRISALLMALVAFWDLLPFPKAAALKSFPVFWEVLTKNKIAYKRFKNIQRAGWYIIAALMGVTIMSDILMIL